MEGAGIYVLLPLYSNEILYGVLLCDLTEGVPYVAVQTYNGYTGEKMTVVLAKALLYTHFNKTAAELALADYKPGDKLIPFKVVGEYKGPDLAVSYPPLVAHFSDFWIKQRTYYKASA